MKFNAIMVVCYGLIVAGGGLAGYLTAGSLPSLIAGSVFGSILFACGLGLFRTSVIAFFTALATSGILTIFFAFRYYLNGNMMPGGMMALVSFSIFMLLITTKGHR